MSERGVFAVERDHFTDPCFAPEPFTEREAFNWMRSEAAWKRRDSRGQRGIITLEPGEVCHSVRFMAEAWQWSKSAVDRFLKKMIVRGKLSDKSRDSEKVYFINAYNDLPKVGAVKRDTSGTAAGHERDSSGTNEKKGNREEDTSEAIASSVSPEPDVLTQAVEAWNEMAKRLGLSIVERLGSKRKSHLKARLAEFGGMPGWLAMLDRIEASDFCAGRKTDFRATFDFAVQSSSFTKIVEGAYDNNPNQRGQHVQHHSHSAKPSFRDKIRQGVGCGDAGGSVHEPVQPRGQGDRPDWPDDEHSGRVAPRQFSFERREDGAYADRGDYPRRYAGARH